MRPWTFGAAWLVLLAACGGAEPRDHVPAHPLTVDTRAVTFRGMRVLDSQAQVRARFGPAKCSDTAPAQPLGEDYYDIGGPTSFTGPRGAGPGRSCRMRYRRLVVFLFPGGVHGFATTDPRAQTERGVGPGDPRSLVRERYPNAQCETANEGTEYATFPLCSVRLERGKDLYFGADPIRSVWLIVSDLDATA